MPTTLGRAHVDNKSLSISEHVMRGWSMLSNTAPFDMTARIDLVHFGPSRLPCRLLTSCFVQRHHLTDVDDAVRGRNQVV